MDKEMMSHVLDIKERLAGIEAMNREIRDDLRVHSEASILMRKEVDKVKADVQEAKIVLRTLKWVAALAFITMPAIAATLLKIYNSI